MQFTNDHLPREKTPEQLLESLLKQKQIPIPLSMAENKPYVADFVFKPVEITPEMLDENTAIGKKYKLAKEICEGSFNAKSKSKSTAKKPVKVHSKADKTAVETI